MCVVYWVKRTGYENPEEQGYVGVSVQIDTRLKQHLQTDNKHLRNAFNKYEDIVVEILHRGSENDCYVMEEKLRPKMYIGWNQNKGGCKPPAINELDDFDLIRKKISDTLKKKNINPYCENTHSEEARNKRKQSMSGRSWYYDPLSGKSKLTHNQPEGWLRGRMPQTKENIYTAYKKFNTKYLKGNARSWSVCDPNGKKYIVYNLKSFCTKMQIPYLSTCRDKRSKGWYMIEERETIRDYDYFYRIALEYGSDYNIEPKKYAELMLQKEEEQKRKPEK